MVLRYILIAVLSYLIGSVNNSILFVRAKYHADIRSNGSGNAGATNATRTYGVRMGLAVLAGDVLKAVLACLLGRALAGQCGLIAAGLFCQIGHCWPVYFGFRGGKGMAVAAGTLLTLDWKLLIVIAVFFGIVFAISRRVSLCSVLSVLVFPPLYYLTERRLDVCFALACMICLLVIFQHRRNILRLLKGTEPKLEFNKK